MGNQITHIHLTGLYGGSERITDVRVSNQNGAGDYTVSEIVKYLKDGYSFFYTLSDGYRGDVIYVDGNPSYIRTKPDRTLSDNLLNLPQF